MNDRQEFTVSADGAFNEDGVWVIDTAVKFAEGTTPQAAAELVGKVRLALLVVIADRAREGRALGATRVKVALDDPGRHFLPNLPDSLETPQ